MKRLLPVAGAAAFVFFAGSGLSLAQDDEDQVELVSKIVPVDIYACSYNDGQGPADLDAAAEGWNAYLDGNGIDNYAAWTLTPFYMGPNQNFDFIWLGAWTGGNAMGTGTDMWLESGGEHLANFMRVATCGTHSNSASLNYKLPEGGNIPGDSVLTFSNCNIEDGANYTSVREATSAWADILAAAGSQAAIYHWFPIYGGGGERPDYITVTAYSNYTELGADYERITNGELFRQSNALFGGLTDCDVSRVYNAETRRSAQLR